MVKQTASLRKYHKNVDSLTPARPRERGERADKRDLIPPVAHCPTRIAGYKGPGFEGVFASTAQ